MADQDKDDFFSFEKAVDKLSLEEDDLKRLISAGEIRAFRDGSRMRLRAEDVERVAKDLGVGEAVGEEAAGEVLEVEEVLFSETADDEGMVTTQLSEEDTLLDDDLEVVEVADERAPAARGGSRPARAAAPAAAEEEPDSPAMLLVSVATTFLLLWGIAFAMGMLKSQSSSVTGGIVGMFADDSSQ